jgi:hypothetical protein
MTITLTQNEAVFAEGPSTAGVFVLNDRYKPYIHPLRTPAGHNVVNAMPVDHRHHKGLMYALNCTDLTFWEECPGRPECGLQKVLKTAVEGEELVLHLLWCHENGSRETYREERRISCRLAPELSGFVWSWRTKREALRPHRLNKSGASRRMADGRRINYHGLGVRLPWPWAYPDPAGLYSGIEIQGKPTTAEESSGTTAPAITFWGRFDGFWDPPCGAVTVRQNHGFGWYVMKDSFSYIATGPTALEEMDVVPGQRFDESYEIVVADRR